MHDFPDPAMPKAVPYGIYDLAANPGWVSVGCDGDTAAFAVERCAAGGTRSVRLATPRASGC